ncbi:MAG: YihY family inner membrane protein [Mariprofundaceae bacterium]
MPKSSADNEKSMIARILDMDVADIASLPALYRHATHLVRFCFRVVQRFIVDKCIQRASALAYASLLAIVPLVALGFSVFTSFQAFESIAGSVRDTLLEYLLPTSQQAVQNYLGSVTGKTTALSVFGIIGLLFTATALLNTIEEAFNSIWRITRDRAWLSKFIAFWATLTLAPIFIGASISITSYFTALPVLKHVAEGATMISHVPFVIPWMMSSLALTTLYMVLPNTSVPFRYAIVGGLVAGALFEGTKFGFAFYVTHVANYERLYGALSTLPIFLIWLYLIWVIVLIGSEITFCLQHPEQSHRRHSNYLRPGVKQYYAHLILLRAAQALKQGESVTMAQLLNETGIPENIMQEWLDDLCSLGLLHSTTGSSAVQNTWVLAQAADQLSLLKIFETLNQVPMKIPETCTDTPLGRRLQGLYYRLDRQNAELMQQTTLRDLMDKESEEQDREDEH